MTSSIFADDTEIHATGTTLAEVQAKLQEDVNRLTHWFRQNKLIINISKTSCMLFSSDKHVLKRDLTLYIGNELISQVTCTRYLGIHPESKLSWEVQIDKLCKTISPRWDFLED